MDLFGIATQSTSTEATLFAKAVAVSVTNHSSGAAILTGSSGYIAGTIGTFAATALSGIVMAAGIVTASATLLAGSTVALSVAGTTYVCWKDIESEK